MTSPNAAYLRARINLLSEQLEKIELRPEDNFEDGAIITFQKCFGRPRGTYYTYAAIKAKGQWYLSGNRLAHSANSWDTIMDFVEMNEDVPPTIRYMTQWAEL